MDEDVAVWRRVKPFDFSVSISHKPINCISVRVMICGEHEWVWKLKQKKKKKENENKMSCRSHLGMFNLHKYVQINFLLWKWKANKIKSQWTGALWIAHIALEIMQQMTNRKIKKDNVPTLKTKKNCGCACSLMGFMTHVISMGKFIHTIVDLIHYDNDLWYNDNWSSCSYDATQKHGTIRSGQLIQLYLNILWCSEILGYCLSSSCVTNSIQYKQ